MNVESLEPIGEDSSAQWSHYTVCKAYLLDLIGVDIFEDLQEKLGRKIDDTDIWFCFFSLFGLRLLCALSAILHLEDHDP